MMILAMGLAGAMASPAMAQKNAKPPKPAPPTAEQEWPAIEGKSHPVAVVEAETSATGAAGGRSMAQLVGPRQRPPSRRKSLLNRDLRDKKGVRTPVLGNYSGFPAIISGIRIDKAPELKPEIPIKEVVAQPMFRCGAASSFCPRTGTMHHVIRLGLVSCLALIPASASRSLAEDAASFERTVRPLLTRHCVSCHGGNEPAANMRLDMPEASFANAAARASWEKVHSQLVRGEMPPPDMPRLSADDLDTLTSWIRRESERGLIAERGAASRTVMRRLTRVEYARLLADVLGLEFQNVRLSLHEKLPLDPQGEGPVNDGELLRF
jgi:hypothetical protein